jgi:hypothetical protein
MYFQCSIDSATGGRSTGVVCALLLNTYFKKGAKHQEKVLHVDMRFFPNMHVGKKSHVDMKFLHVDIRFFSNMHVQKKSHVDIKLFAF